MKIFNSCKYCKECCQTEIGDGFEVFLSKEEQKYLKREKLVIDGKCEFLKENGCILGENKPLMCKAYPLVPHKSKWRITEECPLHKKYLKEIKKPYSSASFHLKKIKNTKINKKLKKQISKYYQTPEETIKT